MSCPTLCGKGTFLPSVWGRTKRVAVASNRRWRTLSRVIAIICYESAWNKNDFVCCRLSSVLSFTNHCSLGWWANTWIHKEKGPNVFVLHKRNLLKCVERRVSILTLRDIFSSCLTKSSQLSWKGKRKILRVQYLMSKNVSSASLVFCAIFRPRAFVRILKSCLKTIFSGFVFVRTSLAFWDVSTCVGFFAISLILWKTKKQNIFMLATPTYFVSDFRCQNFPRTGHFCHEFCPQDRSFFSGKW